MFGVGATIIGKSEGIRTIETVPLFRRVFRITIADDQGFEVRKESGEKKEKTILYGKF